MRKISVQNLKGGTGKSTTVVNLGAAQQFISDITVITRAGAANERRVVANDAFTFENVALTPVIHSLSPTSGPINGGTRVTLFGEGFQAPVQVFFGSAEANVVEVAFGPVETAGSTENRLLSGGEQWLEGGPGIGKLEAAAETLVKAIEGPAEGFLVYPRVLGWARAFPALGRRYAGGRRLGRSPRGAGGGRHHAVRRGGDADRRTG